MPAEPLPRSVTETDGPAYWFLNGLNVVLATSESTGGAYSMLHHTGAPGNAIPYHLHHVEDEAFYVLEGEFTFICQGEKTGCRSGRVYLPAARYSARHSMHRFWSLYDADSGDARHGVCGDDAGDGGACEGAGVAAGDGAGFTEAGEALR
jgi:hypothetical protein